ncbi:hexosaminidase D-like isoform X2 [Diabrotica undecimpunctata]|uniref:hexosaminidase D-like isoform X2 n=1 Tax=Diabrotica undecimpunctata TaxID=50387 RepID=UPI003B638CCC
MVTEELIDLIMEKNILIHLDLKGAPPKPEYLAKFFSFVKSLGATGILLEWEDTFPYTDDIRLLGSLGDSSASKGHYTNEEALEVLKLASQSNLTVIPLVQTIGHMEFVLKYSKFNYLRETKECPNCLCPSSDGSLDLVKCLINQIISFHENCEYIHIGADEVWHMGVCEKCVQLGSQRLRSLWLDHVIKLALYIKSTYPNKKIIVWDDMLRNIDEDLLKQSNIGDLVEPMVWYYQNEDAFFNQNLWDKYCTIFPNIWAASAFKGATSSCQIIPTVAHHIQNQECWIRGLSRYTEKIKNLRGIVLTGWSRFDHYATLCELLPCGIPSLFFSLMTLRHGEYSPEACETEALRINCSFPFNNMTNRPPIFPGSEVYVVMEWLASFIRKYKMEINDDRFNTWFNPWQIKTRHVNRGHILGIHANLEALLGELEIVEKRFDECVVNILYNHTTEELKGTLIDPIKQNINKMLQESKSLIDPGYSSKPQAFKRNWLQAGMSVEENS